MTIGPRENADYLGILNRSAAMLFGLSCEQTAAEILAAAAYSLRGSSNAKSLCSVVAPNSSKILAATPADFDPDGFLSSSPTTLSHAVGSLQCIYRGVVNE
jgi:hypothetical protein